MRVRAVMKNRLLWKSGIWVHYCVPVWKMWSIQQPEVRKDANVYWHYYTDWQRCSNDDCTSQHQCVGCVGYTEKEESCLLSLVLRQLIWNSKMKHNFKVVLMLLKHQDMVFRQWNCIQICVKFLDIFTRKFQIKYSSTRKKLNVHKDF